MAPEPTRIDPESSQFVSAASLRVRLDWFNKLRWGAVAGVLAGIYSFGVWFHYDFPFTALFCAVGTLTLLNLIYILRNRRVPPVDIRAELRLVKLQMLGDLVTLTLLLNLTGGIENPLYFMYVIHVIIASLLFRGREIFQIAGLAILLFTCCAVGEYLGYLPHFHHPSASSYAHELPFLLMSLASFWMVLLFSAYIGARIMRHNRAIKDELVERQKELIAADQAKMDFFRFVTHEVKSPVSTAQSAVETALELGGAQMGASVEDMLSRAVGRLEQANEMVRNLADLTSGAHLNEDRRRDVELNRIVAKVVDGQRDSAGRRGQAIEVHLPQETLYIWTAEGVLEKIVTNLVSNAIRYNRDDGVVSVRLARGRGTVRLQVTDEGIGIAPQDHEKVFEEFYRTRAAMELTNLGTGLGLPIVRKFVTDLGGRISLRSTLGAGSTFTVDLPLRRAGNGGGGNRDLQRGTPAPGKAVQ